MFVIQTVINALLSQDAHVNAMETSRHLKCVLMKCEATDEPVPFSASECLLLGNTSLSSLGDVSCLRKGNLVIRRM